MKSRQHIVVSAENNPYLAWQCKLLHYSCISRLRQPPLFVVHERDHYWRPDFKEIINCGGKVRSVPSYRITENGDDYSPRNTAGTLIQAAKIGYPRDDFVVLCDPDMIFVRPPTFLKRVAAEYYSYLNYDLPTVREAACKLGINDGLLKSKSSEVMCGVPYVVPVAVARELGEAWLAAIDCFSPGVWEISMYAFGLAVIKLKLRLALTDLMITNFRQLDPVGSAHIIHYSYGDDLWNKRDYFADQASAKVWLPVATAPSGTVLGEIVSQLVEARQFYAVREVTPWSPSQNMSIR